MAYVLGQVSSLYTFITENAVDVRSLEYNPLAGKPLHLLAILALYQMFVLQWGPKFMRHRKPFNLDKVMILYNLIQIIWCAYLGYEGFVWSRGHKLICEPVDYSDSEHATKMIQLTNSYFLLKLVDLLDTIFFVLRKKSNQVSFLHVYHHILMVIGTWIILTYVPGGHTSYLGVVNCFVHTFMYTYYLLSLAMPSIKKYVWFKKFITQIQIAQFFGIILHHGAALLVQDCEYPKWIPAGIILNNLMIIVLFINFYIKTYIHKSKTKSNLVQNGSKLE